MRTPLGTPRAAAVVLAAGSGTRVGAAGNKVLLPLAGLPLLAHSLRTVLDVAGVHRIVLVVRPEERELVAEAVAPHLGQHDLWLVDGGAERHDSEWRALQVLAPEIDEGEIEVVAIHDAARPLAPGSLWREVIDTAHARGGALPVRRTPPLLRRSGDPAQALVGPLVAVQTPQAFAARPVLAAHREAARTGFAGTDTAACLEHALATGVDLGQPVAVVGVPSGADNLKVTFPEDLDLVAELLSRRQGPSAAPS